MLSAAGELFDLTASRSAARSASALTSARSWSAWPWLRDDLVGVVVALLTSPPGARVGVPAGLVGLYASLAARCPPLGALLGVGHQLLRGGWAAASRSASWRSASSASRDLDLETRALGLVVVLARLGIRCAWPADRRPAAWRPSGSVPLRRRSPSRATSRRRWSQLGDVTLALAWSSATSWSAVAGVRHLAHGGRGQLVGLALGRRLDRVWFLRLAAPRRLLARAGVGAQSVASFPARAATRGISPGRGLGLVRLPIQPP